MSCNNNGIAKAILKKASKMNDIYRTLCLTAFMLVEQKVHAAANVIGQEIEDNINQASNQDLGTMIDKSSTSVDKVGTFITGLSLVTGVAITLYGFWCLYLNNKEGEQSRGRRWGLIVIAGVLMTALTVVIGRVRGTLNLGTDN